jgi:hypothetical protein
MGKWRQTPAQKEPMARANEAKKQKNKLDLRCPPAGVSCICEFSQPQEKGTQEEEGNDYWC